MKQRSALRIRLLTLGLLLCTCVIAFRLFYIQVYESEIYTELADRQYATPVGEVFDRGTIFFTDKDGRRVTAAGIRSSHFVVANPRLITDIDATIAALSVHLDLATTTRSSFISKKESSYLVLAREVDPDAAQSITDLSIPGISVFRERRRSYPSGSLGAHLLGFVGLSSEGASLPIGRYGLERSYEPTLERSHDGLAKNFFASIFTGVGDSLAGTESQGDVVTAIEPHVMERLDTILAGINEKYDSESVGAIVMEPKTGKIVAMSALPTFSPEQYADTKSQANFKNPLVENVYEMGSIMKAITLASAIDVGAIDANSTYVDRGFVMINGKKISNFDGKGHGETTMQTVLDKSLNTGVVHAMQKMGREKFRTYLQSFGFGEKTGIDLPNEATGLLRNLDSDRDVEHATAAFGQGIAVSPISIARALSALANGGLLMRPYVVTAVEDEFGGVTEIAPKVIGRVIEESTSKEITRMLVHVVDHSLANGKLKQEHYSVAAKTGTAQIAQGGGGYEDDVYLHTFFGYFPASEPRFLVFLFNRKPVGATYASETLTGPFMEIMDYLIHYYQIPPDR